MNGPFQACECSGNLFFGEDRIQCYEEPLPRLVGDAIVICVWNEMVHISEIRQVVVQTSTNVTYALVQEGLPDLLTRIHVQRNRLAAVIATTLHDSWFSNNSTIQSAVALVEADGTFGVSERSHRSLTSGNTTIYSTDQESKDDDSKWFILGGVMIAVLILSVLKTVLFLYRRLPPDLTWHVHQSQKHHAPLSKHPRHISAAASEAMAAVEDGSDHLSVMGTVAESTP